MTHVVVTLAWSLLPLHGSQDHTDMIHASVEGGGAQQRVSMSLLRPVLSASEVLQVRSLLPNMFDLDRADVEMIPKRWIIIERDGVPPDGRERLAAALRPAVENRIMPFVRSHLQCPSCLVCSSIIRRYSHALGERHRDPPHTDGQAFATVVVALDDAGDDYTGGLYVVTDPERPLTW